MNDSIKTDLEEMHDHTNWGSARAARPTATYRRVSSGGTDCRSVATFHGQDCCCVLSPHHTGGSIRAVVHWRQAYCRRRRRSYGDQHSDTQNLVSIGFGSLPDRNGVSNHAGSAVLSLAEAGKQERRLGYGMLQSQRLRDQDAEPPVLYRPFARLGGRPLLECL